MNQAAEHRKRRCVLRVFRAADEAERLAEEATFYTSMTPAERVEFAWQLSLEQWMLAHPEYIDEPGLLRSIVRVVER